MMQYLLILMIEGILIFGAIKRWQWIIDPPKTLFFIYPLSFLRLLFDPEEMVYAVIGQGVIALILVTATMIWRT